MISHQIERTRRRGNRSNSILFSEFKPGYIPKLNFRLCVGKNFIMVESGVWLNARPACILCSEAGRTKHFNLIPDYSVFAFFES